MPRTLPRTSKEPLADLSQPPSCADRSRSAQQHDDLADGQFGDAAGVGEGRVEDGDAAQASCVEIDLVGADREAADGEETLGGGKDRLGQLGARTDAEDMRLLDRLDQLGLVERLRQAGQVGVAGLLQGSDGGIVDPLEQEDAEAVLRKGKPVGGKVHGALGWSSDAPARLSGGRRRSARYRPVVAAHNRKVVAPGSR